MYENQGIKIDELHAINYAHKWMQTIDKLEPLTLMEKMEHGKNCACERCSAYEKYLNEFVEKSNKEIEELAEVIQFVEDSALESKEYSIYIMNTLTALSFKKNIGVVMTPSFLYKICNEENYDTIKRLVNNEKALNFYNENKSMIMEKIQSEAKDYGYTEQELLNKIYEGQKCQNGTESQKQIALANYSIFSVAKDFRDTLDYYNGNISEDALRSATLKINEYYKNESINNKMFELFNKSNKTGNETNEIKSLIEQGADVNAIHIQNSGKDIDTPLSYACGEQFEINDGNHFENLELVKFLIDKGAEVNPRDPSENAPLTTAANCGNLEIVKYLIDKGADVNTKYRTGYTPLMAAQFAIGKNKESVQIAKILIENGANPLIEDNGRRTALDYAKNDEMIKLLEETIKLLKEKSTNDLFEMLEPYMLYDEEIEIRDAILGHIKESLANGADINCVKNCQEEHINEEDGSIGYKTLYGTYSAYNPNLESVTPLMVAVAQNEYDLSKFLIENGANVNIKNKEGKTALDLVVEARKTTLIDGKSYTLRDNEELKNLIISNGGKRGIECELDISETQQENTESNIRRRR